MGSLAILGGTPVRTYPFPAWPRMSETMKSKIMDTLENDRWGVGSQTTAEFEEKFAAFQDAKYCVAISSGTAALWVALKAAGVQAGDEVIVPGYTFIATASSVLMANAVPVFVDIDPQTFNIDPDQIESAITDKTRVIMPVHVGGNPCDMERILDLANRHGIPVVEDAAQAHGAEWDHTKVGALGMGGTFSFQSSKNLASGEGGAVVSNDFDYIERCFSYHNCGRVRDGQWYEHHRLGGNFRMPALASAMLLAQLEDMEQTMALRDRNRARLDALIEALPGMEPVIPYPKATRNSQHIILARYQQDALHEIPRDTFFKAMQAEGVFTYPGYTPLYRERLFTVDSREYPWLSDYSYDDIHLPMTEKIADEESVWLKQNHLLGTEQDIQDIEDAFTKVVTALHKNPELAQKIANRSD